MKGRKVWSVVLAILLLFNQGIIAEAKQPSGTVRVKNRQSFVQELYEMMNSRKESCKFYYKGDCAKIFDENVKQLLIDVCAIDDKGTTDDADYLANSVYTVTVHSSKNGKGNKIVASVLDVTVQYYEDAYQLEEVNQRVAELLPKLELEGKSKYQKIKKIHDFVVNFLQYSHGGAFPYSAYGALTEGSAVCQGYAQLMYKLLMAAGIPCKTVTGKVYTNGTMEDHVWNVVKLKGNWYYLDATWDDPVGNGGMLIYDYFLKGSDTFGRDHVASKRYEKVINKISKKDYKKK